MKTCSKCGELKAFTEFAKDKNRKDGLRSACKACNNATQKVYAEKNADKLKAKMVAYRANDPSFNRRHHLSRKYKLTLEEFDALKAAQDGHCAICPETEGLVVDHDHSCCPGLVSCGACVRGLLCGPCNKGLGHFGDDLSRMASAMKYLSERGL